MLLFRREVLHVSLMLHLIALALACLFHACHGRRLVTHGQEQHHNSHETIAVLPNSHSLAELKQPQAHGGSCMLGRKVLASMLLLASVDAAAGWQTAGHHPNFAFTNMGRNHALLPETSLVSAKARATHPVAMELKGSDGEGKSARIQDPGLMALINELYAEQGSRRSSLGNGPLPEAIWAERRASDSSTQQRDGQSFLEALQEWLRQKMRGEEMMVATVSRSDVEAAQDAIEELQVALGIIAETLVAELDEEKVATLANPLRFAPVPPPEQMWISNPHLLTDALSHPTRYIVNRRRNHHNVCILHGSSRIFEHDEIRNRIHGRMIQMI